MTAPTLARDADGRVALTTEQAAALAWYYATDDPAGELPPWEWEPAGYALEEAIGAEVPKVPAAQAGRASEQVLELVVAALARWALRWAPVVEAAEHAYDAAAGQPRAAVSGAGGGRGGPQGGRVWTGVGRPAGRDRRAEPRD